jgi:hypothetical protein
MSQSSALLTLVGGFQLGEFLRCSVGAISESGRWAPDFVGDGIVLLFAMRRGCTWPVLA